ncbi:MAG: hypothetical protein DMF52_07650 [Acidobacteria bacterium]|nr:MAG: hypothetical protein DMF52_07650 [Acidobacteriota bacterium]
MPSPLRFIPWFCGLPCEPMTLEVREEGPIVAEGGCPACRLEVALFHEEDRPPRVAGKDVSAERAIEAAVRILKEARAPFVYGLSLSSTATARRAIALAEAIGAALDVEGSEAIQADLVALSTLGLPSATFGEIRDRADLFLLWRCDPRRSHPGIFAGRERFGEAGVRPRPVILVPPPGAAGAATDRMLPVDGGADLDAALALRALVNGARPQGGRPGGVPVALLDEAALALRQARYSAILWDPSTSSSGPGVAIAMTLTLLGRDLNATTRSAVRPLGAGGNVAGAVAALAAATGYPRAVSFAGGATRCAPGEFDAARMIGAQGADVLLLVGARAVEPAPGPGIIVLGPRLPRGVDNPDVWIPTATPGLSAAGMAARADGVTVILKALVPARLPTEEAVLDRLLGPLVAKSRSGTARGAPSDADRQARSVPRRG